jgi:hypothetical protein
MPSPSLVEVGRKFQPADANMFGSLAVIWTVERIFDGADGRSHALLVRISDRTARKTLSVETLLDRRLYRPVESLS